MPAGSHTAATLVELLQRQAERYRDKVAFSFSYHGDDADRVALSYAQLDAGARAIAAELQRQGATGQRVLVFCRPGLDHIVGFFGCLYAGAIAIPVHQRQAPRLSAVIPDAQASFALAATDTQNMVRSAVELLGGGRPLRWLTTDGFIGAAPGAADWIPPAIEPDSTAMIQYTSGSTRNPIGVVLTHRNLLHNLSAIHQVWPADDRELAVWWLPQHHDMGLIGAILAMVDIGATTALMSPTAFIKEPMRWLQAMSRLGATFSTAPNFAYQACVERSTPEERAALDLSHWTVAMNGAEPIQAATQRAFAAAFAPAGFRAEAFRPVYGLAEATLLVSGGSASPGAAVRHIDQGALGEDRVLESTPGDPDALELVGCGLPRGGQRVVIVDPETALECSPDGVGEIWVAGDSVGQGYWNKPEETEQTFGAVLARPGQDGFTGPFLRTGDRGFLLDGELYIVGRSRDLMVIGGRHYYPNHVESTVQGCHPALLSGRGAVFTVAVQPEQPAQLVVVQELDRPRLDGLDPNALVEPICTAVAQRDGLLVGVVFLVDPLAIPTTSSGKIQRAACRQQLLGGDLTGIVEWFAPVPVDDAAARRRAAAEKMAALIQANAAGRQAPPEQN